MGKFRFKRGLSFWLSGKEYVIKKRLSNNDFQVCNAITEELSSFSEEALVSFLFERKLSLEPPQANADSKRRDYREADFSQVDDSLKEEARRREKYVKEYLSQGLQKRTEAVLKPIIEKVANEIKDKNPPNWSTLYRWIKKYEGQRNDIRALITRNVGKGNRKSRLDIEVDQIINEVIDEYYLTLEKPNVQAACSEIIFRVAAENLKRSRIGLEQLRLPNRSTIYRRVDKLDPYEEAIKRYGRATADRMFHVSENARPYPTRPLEMVEIDHSKLPIYVIDPETNLPIGTPWLTTALDKFTGIPIGYYLSFEPPSALSVMQCLLHAIKPKTYVSKKYPSVSNTWDTFGLLEALRPDNGPEFYGKTLEDGCDQLDIDIDYTPPRSAWYKGSVERFFGMINTMLLRGQPGSFLKFLKVYDDEYDPKKPSKKGAVSYDGLNEIVHIFIVDIVCQMSHPKFGTPRINVWRTATLEFPPALPSDEKDLRVLLGAITHRVISEKGVEFERLYYNSPELARLRHIYEKRDKRRKTGAKDKEKAKIKYDPTDISCIYVFNPETDSFVTVPAVDQQYTQGLSLWQHRVIKRHVAEQGKEVNITELAIAKKKIQEIVEREWKSTKQGRTKVSMARYLGVGRDALDLSGVEAFVKEQASKDEERQDQETAPNFGSVQDSSDILAGVSDIGITYDSVEVKQQGEEVQEDAQGNEAVGELINDTDLENECSLAPSTQQTDAEEEDSEKTLQTSKKEKSDKKTREKKSSKDKSTSKNDSKPAEQENELDDWVPDAGWSTNYDS
ncbi:DDE-type integrase/transposase/recombinase [Leptolyngbya sp. PL-A3]|uniref:Mu transposase C-terminal domain-containing protein n=1 Tax=Leptolyngbya sp. PL-A3 TaxID=2933911 RepID=UPI00329A7584